MAGVVEPSALDLRGCATRPKPGTDSETYLDEGASLTIQALRKHLPEPLKVYPVVMGGRKTYAFRGKVRVSVLLDQVILRWRPQRDPYAI